MPFSSNSGGPAAPMFLSRADLPAASPFSTVPVLPDNADAEEFSRRAAGEDNTAEQPRAVQDAAVAKKHKHEEKGQKSQPRGDAILATLGTMRGAAQAVNPAPPPQAGGLHTPLVDAVVQGVQCNLPAAGQKDTVRLDINPALLPDTAIVLQRTDDGSLSVRISTTNAASELLLFQQADRLTSALNRLNAGTAHVEINGSAAGQDGSQDGRSRNRDITEVAVRRRL